MQRVGNKGVIPCEMKRHLYCKYFKSNDTQTAILRVSITCCTQVKVNGNVQSLGDKGVNYGMTLDSKLLTVHVLHNFYACILLTTNKCLSI